MTDYDKFEFLLSEMLEGVQSNQEFGHSMKVSSDLTDAINKLETANQCLLDVAVMVEEAYGL